MKILHIIAFILVIIGGLNWGLIAVGAFVGQNWDVLGLLLGSVPQLLWVVYVLVGLSAIWLAITHTRDCRMCSARAM